MAFTSDQLAAIELLSGDTALVRLAADGRLKFGKVTAPRIGLNTKRAVPKARRSPQYSRTQREWSGCWQFNELSDAI